MYSKIILQNSENVLQHDENILQHDENVLQHGENVLQTECTLNFLTSHPSKKALSY